MKLLGVGTFPSKVMVFFIASITTITAKLPKYRNLQEISPEDIGLYHTEAFERLTDMYAKQDPTSHEAVLDDMLQIVLSFCADEDCIESTMKTMNEKDLSSHVGDLYTEIPDEIDHSVKEYLELFRSTILTLNMENDSVDMIDKLESIQDKLREDDGISEEEKYLGLAAGSVAIESSKLWTRVLRDHNHPLHSIRRIDSDGNRDLQEITIDIELGPFAQAIITADFFGLLLSFGIPIGAILASTYAYLLLIPSPEPSMTPSMAPSSEPSKAPA